jgi:hypothetical protein
VQCRHASSFPNIDVALSLRSIFLGSVVKHAWPALNPCLFRRVFFVAPSISPQASVFVSVVYFAYASHVYVCHATTCKAYVPVEKNYSSLTSVCCRIVKVPGSRPERFEIEFLRPLRFETVARSMQRRFESICRAEFREQPLSAVLRLNLKWVCADGVIKAIVEVRMQCLGEDMFGIHESLTVLVQRCGASGIHAARLCRPAGLIFGVGFMCVCYVFRYSPLFFDLCQSSVKSDRIRITSFPVLRHVVYKCIR